MADTIKLDTEEEVPLTSEELYEKALRKMDSDSLIVKPAFRGENYRAAAAIFESLGSYEDAQELSAKCLELAGQADEEARKKLYEKTQAVKNSAKTAEDWEKIIEAYEELGDYKDSQSLKKGARRMLTGLERKRRRRQILTILLLLAVAAGGFYGFRIGLFKYAMGFAYRRAEMYRDAQAAYRSLGDFLDAPEKALEAEMAGLKAAEKGEEVIFGDYRWLVLSHKEDTLRLIVKTISEKDTPELYGRAFHDRGVSDGAADVTWAESSLRGWLNGAFLEEHFTDGERACLLGQENAESVNENYGTVYPAGAGVSSDLVTILSAQQAVKYRKTLSDLPLNWWVRTPGNTLQAAAFRTSEGEINWYGDAVGDAQLAVRPVIRVKTE